ncbi:Pyruvate/Phosphoenolpyruvate kinase-like domain-containing protein [Xylaria cf. heliscus]|nr:Pyruvate/Phosphoenolpyruvate kinase-like domain-containing protein [Xylaria cf. heliscus]
MPPASAFLRRALLYVPGSSRKMLTKSFALAIDSVIYDLEDSVTADSKPLARDLVANHIASDAMSPLGRGPKEVSVRINAVETGLALQDLSQVIGVAGSNLDTIVVPKVQSATDLQFVADVIHHLTPDRVQCQDNISLDVAGSASTPQRPRPLHLIGLIESALGLANIQEICRTGRSLGLVGLGFAAEDFMSSMGLRKLPDRREVLLARSSIVNACRAYDLPSAIDMVSVNVLERTDGPTLEEECQEGRSLGFTGKQAIHPSQVEVIQRAFGPSEAEIRWAAQVCVGDIEAREQGKGAWSLDGRMVDAPVVKAATALIDRARACGIDVDVYIRSMRN